MDPLQRLLDEARRDQAVEARAHEHWLRRAAREGATLTGALVDLAESGQPASVRIASGHVHHGRVVAVGTDFCAVETDGGVVVYISLSALGEVRLDPGAPPTGNRAPTVDMTLAEALGRVADDRPRVAAVTQGMDAPMSGELCAVGADVLTVKLEGGRLALVAVAALTQLSVFASG